MRKGVTRKESLDTYWQRELNRLMQKGYSEEDARTKIVFRQTNYDLLFKFYAPVMKKAFKL